MLTRLAAVVLAFSLGGGSLVDAHGFAQPPHPQKIEDIRESEMRLPIVPIVQAPTKAEVRNALDARRRHNLASFRAYRKAGVYPHNFVRMGPLNVWMDAEGHLCAAATMIDKDGKHDLVTDTGTTNNSIRLLDVTDGALMDWLLTSGFTLEEIDRIQAPMVYPDGPMAEPPGWREAEDSRLRKDYAKTDAWLVKHAKAGLDSAVVRLMAHPELARKLVDGKL